MPHCPCGSSEVSNTFTPCTVQTCLGSGLPSLELQLLHDAANVRMQADRTLCREPIVHWGETPCLQLSWKKAILQPPWPHGRLLKSPSSPALLESPTEMEAVTWTKKEFSESLSHNEGRKTVALINTFERWSPTLLVLHPTHLGCHALRHLRRVQCCNNQPCPPLSFFQ